MKESQYVTDIINALNKAGAKAVKFVETEFSEIGTPDIVGSFEGYSFVVEAKVVGNFTSEIQKKRLEEWAEAGAIAIIVTYPGDKPDRIVEYITHEYTPEPYSALGWQKDFDRFMESG